MIVFSLFRAYLGVHQLCHAVRQAAAWRAVRRG